MKKGWLRDGRVDHAHLAAGSAWTSSVLRPGPGTPSPSGTPVVACRDRPG